MCPSYRLEHLLDICSGEVFLDPLVVLCPIFWGTAKLISRVVVCDCDDKESRQREHTHRTHTVLLQHSFNASREKDDQLLGRRPRTQETLSLNRPQEGLETYFTLTGCSSSAQMTPRDRQGTRNGKIPQHMCRFFVYQLEHRISAPSCNGDCKGGSSKSSCLRSKHLDN